MASGSKPKRSPKYFAGGMDLEVDGLDNWPNAEWAVVVAGLSQLLETPNSYVRLTDRVGNRYIQAHTDGDELHMQYRDRESGLRGANVSSFSELVATFGSFAQRQAVWQEPLAWDLVLNIRGLPIAPPND